MAGSVAVGGIVFLPIRYWAGNSDQKSAQGGLRNDERECCRELDYIRS
jgi:hypothetical protein